MTRNRVVLAAVVIGVSAGNLHAEKLTKEFRAEFERTFKTRSTYAVVMQEGIPTVSVYGSEPCDSSKRSTDSHHFSVDITGGRWSVSQGLLDTDQKMMDTLKKGELMELNRISYKDNRIELRFVTLEAHKFTCGFWKLKTEPRDPMATYFKFFLPFEKKQTLGAEDAVDAFRYIEEWLKVFPSEDAARAYAAKLARGRPADEPRAPASRPAAASGPAPSQSGTAEKREIKVGMTPLQVIDILGKPQKETTFENQSKWTYPDLTVIFENGKVKEVRF